MLNCLNTNFTRLTYNTEDVIKGLEDSARNPGSVLTKEDVEDDNKLIYGVYKIVAPCVLELNFKEALDFIYKKETGIVKPETITRTAKHIGYRFNSHKSGKRGTTAAIYETLKACPELLNKLDVNVLLYEVLRRLEPAIETATFGEVLLAADLPAIDSVIRRGREIRKENVKNGGK